MDSGKSKDIIVVVVILFILLTLFIGGGIALYFLVIKKDHVIDRVGCDASEYGWANRTDAIKAAPQSVQKKYHDCKTNLCKQDVCLDMKDTCWAPVFVQPGKTGPPWCFKSEL